MLIDQLGTYHSFEQFFFMWSLGGGAIGEFEGITTSSTMIEFSPTLIKPER